MGEVVESNDFIPFNHPLGCHNEPPLGWCPKPDRHTWDIYSYPADTFVATFIGSPEMNLYRGRLLHKDGRPHFQGAGFSLDLEGLHFNLQKGEVEVGIRPADIGISQGRATAIQARVEMISNVGRKSIYTPVSARRISRSVPPKRVPLSRVRSYPWP